MVIMVNIAQTNANVRMKLYAISELAHAIVQPDGWGNSATQVSISFIPDTPILSMYV